MTGLRPVWRLLLVWIVLLATVILILAGGVLASIADRRWRESR